jgi:hypothetical protein
MSRPLLTIVSLFALAVMLSGCVVEPAYPGFCYYHPHRCGY